MIEAPTNYIDFSSETSNGSKPISFDSYIENFQKTPKDEYIRLTYGDITIPFQGNSADLLQTINAFGIIPKRIAVDLVYGANKERKSAKTRLGRLLRSIDEKFEIYGADVRVIQGENEFEPGIVEEAIRLGTIMARDEFLSTEVKHHNNGHFYNDCSTVPVEKWNVLSFDDIEEIISYKPDNYTFGPEEMNLLYFLLDGYEVAPSRVTPDTIEKINNLLLKNTGCKIIKFSPNGKTTSSTVKLIKSGQIAANNLKEQLTRNLKEAKHIAENPPFELERTNDGKKTFVSLSNRKKQSSKIELKEEIIPSLHISTGEKFKITIDNQVKLIKFLLKNPSSLRSTASSRLNDTTTTDIHPILPREMEQILRTVDKVFNSWGMGIEVEHDLDDEEILKLTHLRIDHKPPSLMYKNANYDEEVEALPERQRRRGPSHGKIRL